MKIQRDLAHTNAPESFSVMLKLAYYDTIDLVRKKYLNRYESQFAGRHHPHLLNMTVQMKSGCGHGGKANTVLGLGCFQHSGQ